MQGGRRTGGVAEAVKGDKSVLRVERANGLRRASVRDFHSLRVTWVTLALTAGVPLELVQRVTGHKTADVVLKHYFRPGQEDFRLALEGAMPTLLTASATPKLLTAGSEKARAGLAQAGTEVVANPPPLANSSAAKEEMRELIADGEAGGAAGAAVQGVGEVVRPAAERRKSEVRGPKTEGNPKSESRRPRAFGGRPEEEAETLKR